MVAYSVIGTSGVADTEQGLATGLTSMTQEVACTVGTPVLSAIAATQATQLTGMHLALSVAATLILATALLVYLNLRPRLPHPTPTHHSTHPTPAIP
jgi:hypothetical protein